MSPICEGMITPAAGHDHLQFLDNQIFQIGVSPKNLGQLSLQADALSRYF